jgi:hypothetical protein
LRAASEASTVTALTAAGAAARLRQKEKNPQGICGFLECGGGDEGDRTLDLRIANATLSQLSYVPGSL